jgi:hypothetical protein
VANPVWVIWINIALQLLNVDFLLERRVEECCDNVHGMNPMDCGSVNFHVLHTMLLSEALADKLALVLVKGTISQELILVDELGGDYVHAS